MRATRGSAGLGRRRGGSGFWPFGRFGGGALILLGDRAAMQEM